jgi:hypothetical protein
MAKQNPGNGNSRNAADKRGLDHSSAGDVHARDTTRHCRGARSPGWQRAWLSNSKSHGTPVNVNWGFLNAAAFIWFYWLCN